MLNKSLSATGAAGTSQADLLASKSNYEWIAEGRHAEMGLHFSTAMATGVMMKRATHRAAEQARRDRMKTAMVDIAEFLLDGEVTFGSGTTCFVVMRNQDDDGEGAVEGVESVKGGKGGEEKDGKRRTTINKSRLIEMALEKLKAQEKEIDLLTERLKHCQCSMETEDTEMS
ncbi:hypothetical protein BDV95DRAFT_478707 [Massariosphaeria phaeospora]|uniref:BHLH domain-containing protein n=1 Tax=Massariosphaeria phaeospora TaxID=100035 RepID=A0A7C8MHF7_9PLEO|nr:hypothetical protein BDV95DRAFT_478707 [Massariosphaeria phaeospora]